MNSYDKEHKERFLKFKKALIDRGAYFDFIEELCRCSDFVKYTNDNKKSNLLAYYENHYRKDLLIKKCTPWINYDYFFTSWGRTVKGGDYWCNLLKRIGYF